MATTLLANLVNPQVLGDYIEEKLTDKMVFSAVADIDATLVGRGGDTLTLPKYAYIGKANVVAENGQIVPVQLNATTVAKQVHKIAKGVQLTDEAVLSAYGDAVQEAGDQLVIAIADELDDEVVNELKTSPLSIGITSALSADDLIDAVALFGEDIGDEPMALFLNASALAGLRKDPDYINGSDIATEIKLRGAIGELWGCQMIPTNRVKNADGEEDYFIVKRGGVKMLLKRDTIVEADREPDYARTAYYATKHGVPWRYRDDKVVVIRKFTGLQALTEGVTSVAGANANGTILKIDMTAPAGYKWVYKLGTTDVTPTYGTALSSTTDWVSSETEIAASTNTKALVALVNADDNKPVKYINVALVKGA